MSKSQRLNKYFTYSIIGTQEAKLLASVATQRVSQEVVDPSCWIGIEIEVEGISSNTPFSSEFWVPTTDGSLRNHGMEYVSVPLRGRLIPIAIKQLHAYLTTSQKAHDFSSRTSVHIHQNVRYLTIEQIFNLLLCYMVVEPILYEYSRRTTGRERETNNFCVPLHDSKFSLNLPQAIEYMQKGEELAAIKLIGKHWKKYTGLNLIPIQSQGTFEYRHMGGTSTPETLIGWINMLQSLRGYAKDHTYEEVKQLIFSLNTTSSYLPFVEEVLGTSFGLSTFDLQQLMEKSVETIKEVYSTAGYTVPFDIKSEEIFKAPLYRSWHKRLGAKLIGVYTNVDDKAYMALLKNRQEIYYKLANSEITTEVFKALLEENTAKFHQYETENPNGINIGRNPANRQIYTSPLMDL